MIIKGVFYTKDIQRTIEVFKILRYLFFAKKDVIFTIDIFQERYYVFNPYDVFILFYRFYI
jgi:hypothetical protein